MLITKIDGCGRTATTIETIDSMLRNGQINPDDYYAVKINYNAYRGIGAEDTPEYYPVKFIGIGHELWLSDLTTGYRGEGPRGTQTVLMLMDFDRVADNEKMLMDQKIVNETFYKNNEVIEYNYETMCIASDYLHTILDGGISEENLNQFEEVVFSLKWEGKSARKFRRNASEIINQLRSRDFTKDDIYLLREIAGYPRKYAGMMIEQDYHLARLIAKI